MAGGELACACDIDRVTNNPELLAHAQARTAGLDGMLKKIVNACGSKSIATTISNAAPELFTFILYPGMPPHTNGVELAIRHHIVSGRKKNGPFPNWMATNNFSTVRTFTATCEQQGLSVHDTIISMADDPDWDIFASGVPPPIFARCAVEA